ncbi:MAG: hypothetical protein WCT22_03345 [Patescibacteria group bacterium]|jgi:hypothetical protein
MKLKIKPFLRRLLKENIYYLIGNIFIFVLIIVTIKIGITNNSDYEKKISSLKIELNQLKNKVTLMNTTVPSSEKLDEDLYFLNNLIPNLEDYFSIVYALEKLSQKTNFIITSYTVSVGNSTAEKLKLNVSGTGDSQTFIDFLKNYNFGGGRLITSDKIQLDPNFFGTIKIDLTFYTKNVSLSQNLEMEPDDKIFKELEALKSKVNFAFEFADATSEPDLSYPRKLNPF